jgi:hypothetical protein
MKRHFSASPSGDVNVTTVKKKILHKWTAEMR